MSTDLTPLLAPALRPHRHATHGGTGGPAPDAGRRGLMRTLCRCAGGWAALGTLATAGGLGTLGGCSRGEGPTTAAVEPGATASCSLDGMLLADYPGPKGQLWLAGQSGPAWFCDTTELLHALLQPEQIRTVHGAWVQDMARADWDRPQGHWIDARHAHYVLGSSRHGSMGPTAASFSTLEAARQFQAAHGGRTLAWAEIRPEMVDLSGGALHDNARM
jgi:copper chaperone NosL